MTDVYKELRNEWMETLLQLWHAYNKTPNPAQVKTYVAQLGHIQLGMLEAAVAHLLANHKYNSTPTIAEVLEAVEVTNRHDWRDVSQYIKVYSNPNREWYESHKAGHMLDEYRKTWQKINQTIN
jgi:hypothetical protein